MKHVRVLGFFLLTLLCACNGGAIKPIVYEPLLLSNGNTITGAVWEKAGVTTTTNSAVLVMCNPKSSEKHECAPISAGTLGGEGYMALANSILHASAASTIGALLAPKPAGVSIAPRTVIQTNFGLGQ